ncbi:hypothetical protein NMG60_11034791 [Bertholletia excelsa]
MAQIDSSRQELGRLKKELFKCAMKGSWNEVKKIYRNHAEVRNAKITRSGDTALHIAVSDGKEEIVKDLVELIPKDDKALAIQNDEGNTPLHLAAALGNVRMCTCIATRDPKLIGVRNGEKETPFFVAVLNGSKEAFLCLHTLCGSNTKGYDYCRKSDGESILHCAIHGEYFDLAFQIIHLYKDLANFVNKEGLSPLHVLADKPSLFSGGSNLDWLGKIVYACTFVHELKIQEDTDGMAAYYQYQIKSQEEQDEASYPKNCQTCVNLLGLFGHAYRALFMGETNSERDAESRSQTDKEHQRFPPTYNVCLDTVKFVSKALIIMLGFGYTKTREIQARKENNTWSMQIMSKLLESSKAYEYDANGQEPDEQGTSLLLSFSDSPSLFPSLHDKHVPEDGKNQTTGEKEENDKKDEKEDKKGKKETPILLAAKNGIAEMVKDILDFFPVAIHDTNSEKKNAVLLAVEYRQPDVYKLLDKRDILKDSIFRKVDRKGNSALHLAAKLGQQRSPWLIPGDALQMQSEIKWFEFVKKSMPVHFFPRYNHTGQTAEEVFSETHKDLVEKGRKWLSETSNSCSVAAGLITTVAFNTATTVPGGVNQDSGTPTLAKFTAFNIFALSSLLALILSVTALAIFLRIFTSSYHEHQFRWTLPGQLLVGLSSLVISAVSMLLSFCAGHFFVIKDKLKDAAFPFYAVMCLPVMFFVVAQFPLFINLILAMCTKVPQRNFKVNMNP